MARALMERGFTLVRPLAGGLDAWVLAGFAVVSEPEPPDLIAIRPAESGR
ncbi:MAG TPA: hypothetical protein VKG01_16775 [Thermoanaerobaculia bacterium]|nr:hypothetical protein [Thermoanaerobaculia bacterium]